MAITINAESKSQVNRRRRSPRAGEGEEPTERSKEIVRVAGDLFLARGFEGVSLETIVAKTGGSFRDLYRKFGSKEELFLRVLSDLCDEVIAPLHAIERNLEVELPLEQVLSSIGKQVLATLLSPKLLELHRLILSEAKRFPALGNRWYETGPNTANRVLAAVLKRYSQAGLLQTADPCILAAIFLDSLINSLQLRKLTGLVVPQADIDQRVQLCVQIFLDGVRERHGNPASHGENE